MTDPFLMNQQNHYLNTPLFKSHELEKRVGLNVYYKMDCFQPSGSFKIRGMDSLLQDLFQRGHREVIASSGGNAGYSLAYVAKQMGVTTRLIVPETTSAYMIAKIRLLGSEIEIHGKNWNEAHAHASRLSKEKNLLMYRPLITRFYGRVTPASLMNVPENWKHLTKSLWQLEAAGYSVVSSRD